MAKVLIDIPEDTKGRLSFGVTYKNDIEILCETLSNGIVLNGLTNGEIMQKIFPQLETRDSGIGDTVICVRFSPNEFWGWLDAEGWNRKWGES